MPPGPLYDLLVGLLISVLTAALLAVFGLASVLGTPAGSSSVALFVLASASSFVAASRPESSVGGHRVDYLTFRGLSGVAMGLVLLLQGVLVFLGGDLFLTAVMVIGAPTILAIGVGTMLRKEWIVPDARTA